jgi:hypothetical protein
MASKLTSYESAAHVNHTLHAAMLTLTGAPGGSTVKWGGVIVHAEIYQVTGPLERFCRLIASEVRTCALGAENRKENMLLTNVNTTHPAA